MFSFEKKQNKKQTPKSGKRRGKPTIWIVGMAVVQFLHHHFRHVKMVHGCLCKHFSASVVEPFLCSHQATALHRDCSHVICCIEQEKVCCACYYKAASKCINVSASHWWMLLQPLSARNCGACFIVAAVERHLLRIWSQASSVGQMEQPIQFFTFFLKTSSLQLGADTKGGIDGEGKTEALCQARQDWPRKHSFHRHSFRMQMGTHLVCESPTTMLYCSKHTGI